MTDSFDDRLGMPDGPANLWRLVLMTAVDDAFTVPPGNSLASIRIRTIQDARDYLIRPNNDFNEVCSLAGLDPKAVREHTARRVVSSLSPQEMVAAGDAKRLARRTKTAALPGTLTVHDAITNSLAVGNAAHVTAGVNHRHFFPNNKPLQAFEALDNDAYQDQECTHRQADIGTDVLNTTVGSICMQIVEEDKDRIADQQRTDASQWMPIHLRTLSSLSHDRHPNRSPHSVERGVVFNLRPVLGTGGGSTVQETPNITFSEKAPRP